MSWKRRIRGRCEIRRREFFQELREAIIAFWVPYHPEVTGTFEMREDEVTTLSICVWGLQGKDFVPIFTSCHRAEQALTAIGAMDERNALGEMRGAALFSLLASQDVPVVINPGCGTGVMFLDARVIANVADGSILSE